MQTRFEQQLAPAAAHNDRGFDKHASVVVVVVVGTVDTVDVVVEFIMTVGVEVGGAVSLGGLPQLAARCALKGDAVTPWVPNAVHVWVGRMY